MIIIKIAFNLTKKGDVKLKKMYLLILLIFTIFLVPSSSYCQLGWYFQNSGVTSNLNSIRFFDGNTAWAAGWTPYILKTTNGGNNWLSIYSGNAVDYQSVFFADANTGWVVGQNGVIIKSTNGGNNWFNQSSGVSSLLMFVKFINVQTGWVAGYNGTILKTTNGGQNWIQKNSGVYSNLLCIYFLNSNLGFVSGDNGLIKRSTNGGETWNTIYTPLNYNLDKFFFINDNIGWVTGINGTILKTTNSGLTWLFTYTGVTSWITAVHFFDLLTGYACGGDYNSPEGGIILKTINGGISWTPTTHPLIPWMSFINFTSPDTGWAVGKNGIIMKTVDGGNPPPLAPALIWPLNDSLVNTLTPTLQWSTCSGAQNYTYIISQLSQIIDSGTTTNVYHTIPAGKLSFNITYQWKVKASNVAGPSQWSSQWNFTPRLTNIVNNTEIPDKFNLSQNYPNPFNPVTQIKYSVPNMGNVNITVFDALGREVMVLINEVKSPGVYTINYNANNLTSGIYFYKLTSSNFTDVKKMMLVK